MRVLPALGEGGQKRQLFGDGLGEGFGGLAKQGLEQGNSCREEKDFESGQVNIK